jgi:hypothetical protein
MNSIADGMHAETMPASWNAPLGMRCHLPGAWRSGCPRDVLLQRFVHARRRDRRAGARRLDPHTAARIHFRHQAVHDRLERIERCFGRIAELQVELGVARHDRGRVRLDACASHRPDAALRPRPWETPG